MDGPHLFTTALAVCNAAALGSLAVQWRGLIGARGITPAADYIRRAHGRVRAEEATRSRNLRTIFPWFRTHPRAGRAVDRVASAAAALEVAPSVFMLTGASDWALQAGFAVGFAAAVLLILHVAPTMAAAVFAVSHRLSISGSTAVVVFIAATVNCSVRRAGCATAPPTTGSTPTLPALALLLSPRFATQAVYCSFSVVGNPWMGLQFEPMLIEVNAVFAATYAFAGAAPAVWVLCLRWLTFRLMLAAGAGKLSSGDPAWRRGTAMVYHYETQPLPNGLSRFMHRLSARAHWYETVATFGPEGLVPLVCFWAGPTLRRIGFLITAAFNVAIGVTGNYGHLHMLAICFALSLVLETSCPCPTPEEGAGLHIYALHAGCAAWPPTWAGAAIYAVQWIAGVVVALGYVLISLPPLVLNFRGLVELKLPPLPGWDLLQAAFVMAQHYRVVGYYNLFANMTRTRWELQLEGSADGGATWHPFGYVAKPGGDTASLDERPRTLLPGYIPRLDWRMWFLPLALQRQMRIGIDPAWVAPEAWYTAFARKVLAGEPDVLALLRVPAALTKVVAGQVASKPSQRGLDAVRTLVYEYRFSDGKKCAGGRVGRDIMIIGARASAADKGPPGVEARPTETTTVRQAAAEPSGESDSVASANPLHAEPPVNTTAGKGAARGSPSAGRGRPRLTEERARRERLPSGEEWEEGKFWRRRFVCVYDVQLK
jgi:hypothetical protein